MGKGFTVSKDSYHSLFLPLTDKDISSQLLFKMLLLPGLFFGIVARHYYKKISYILRNWNFAGLTDIVNNTS